MAEVTNFTDIMNMIGLERERANKSKLKKVSCFVKKKKWF